MRKIIIPFFTLVALTLNIPVVSAKQQGDWNAIKDLPAQEVIAIKTTDGATRFGLLVSADDYEIKLHLADKDRLASQETRFRRDQIKKVWRAKLRFGVNNMTKGAWIGAGAGLGAAFLTAWAIGQRKDSAADTPIGAVLFPVYGAGIGGLIGIFHKKGHKKVVLIYRI